MHLEERKLFSSLDLPAYPQDYVGHTFYCAERGSAVGYYTPWDPVGGEWQPRGPSYVGALSGLPAAANVRLGTRAIIDEAAPGGLTRPPAAGVKMNRLRLVCAYLPDGTTKAWRPEGDQILYKIGGNVANPACANFTSVAATGIIAEVGTLPANLFAVNGLELYVRATGGRSTTAAGTATFAMLLGPTPGTAGTTTLASGLSAANVNAVVWIEGSVWARTSGSQFTTLTLTPEGASANIASQMSLTQDMTVAQTIQFAFSGATVGDIFNIPSFEIGIR